MKYLAIISLLTASAFSHVASAQSDYAVTWSLDSPFTISGTTYNRLTLDINEGSRYLTANGILSDGTRLGRAVTGTCFLIVGGSINCGLSLDLLAIDLRLASSLDGQIIVGFDDSADVTSSVTLSSVE